MLPELQAIVAADEEARRSVAAAQARQRARLAAERARLLSERAAAEDIQRASLDATLRNIDLQSVSAAQGRRAERAAERARRQAAAVSAERAAAAAYIAIVRGPRTGGAG